MLHRRYFVTRSQPRDLASIKAALYDHTRVAGLEENITDGLSQGRTVTILETTSDSADRADYLAAYQAGRLQSFGGIGVSQVFEIFGSAVMYAGEEYDAYPDMVHTRTPSQVAAESLAREFGTDVSEWEV